MPVRGRSQVFDTSNIELTPVQLRSKYQTLIERALAAFCQDPSYIIDMAEHGSLIKYKKNLWAVRMEVLHAEKAARQLCSADKSSFTCTNDSACGFGNCRWATPEFASIKLPPPSSVGKPLKERPVESKSPTYRIEDAIKAVLTRRRIVPPARLSSGHRSKDPSLEPDE